MILTFSLFQHVFTAGKILCTYIKKTIEQLSYIMVFKPFQESLYCLNIYRIGRHKTFFVIVGNFHMQFIHYIFTALFYYAHNAISFMQVVNLSERLRFTKKFPEKFWKFGNLPRDILGILGGVILPNSFLRLYVCACITFVINSSRKSPRNFGGTTLFVKKFRNFGKFWKILEIFGNFWKIFGKMSRRKKILEIFGNFCKNFRKL